MRSGIREIRGMDYAENEEIYTLKTPKNAETKK